MPVKVSFMRPAFVGDKANLAFGSCRICETLTVPASTTASAQDGEFIVISSTEAATVVCAHGTTPDGAATAETAETTAGYPVPPSQVYIIQPKVGDKVNAKAFV